jgi:hypothetical protein
MEEIAPPKLRRTEVLIDPAMSLLQTLNRAWVIRKAPLLRVYLEILLPAKSTPQDEC